MFRLNSFLTASILIQATFHQLITGQSALNIHTTLALNSVSPTGLTGIRQMLNGKRVFTIEDFKRMVK